MKIIIALLLLSPSALACDKGYEPYEGNCVAQIAPEQAPSVQPSDEKPPRSGMPAWESPNIHIVDAPSCAAEDAKQDAEKNDADIVGKKAAGINK